MNIGSKAALAAGAAALAVGAFLLAASQDEHAVTFSGGRDLGEDDHGRPCVLIAAALGVKTEVFREAFRGVRPARGRGPTSEEARKNKETLLNVLGPHGVTNERLDEVSNYYRFRPQNGELWTHVDARAKAVVENGGLVRVELTEPGSGYASPPKIVVKGFEDVECVATLHFDRDLAKNGSIASIEIKKPRTE